MKPMLILGGLGLVSLMVLIAATGGVPSLTRFGEPSSTIAADYTSAEVTEIFDLLRNDPACRDTRMQPFMKGCISLELLRAVLGQPISKRGGFKHSVWTYRTNDGAVTISPWRVLDSSKPFISVPVSYLEMGTVKTIGLNANNPVDREALKQTIIHIKSGFDEGDGEKLAKQLAAKKAAERAALEAKARQRDLEMAAQRRQAELEQEARRKARKEQYALDSDRNSAVQGWREVRASLPYEIRNGKEVLSQRDGWITRRTEVLTESRKNGKERDNVPLPGRDVLLAALERNISLPVRNNPLPTEQNATGMPSSDRQGKESSQRVRQFTGHSGVAFSVDISPDGKTIISGGEGEEVILWNIASGEEIARLKGVRGSVRAVAFSDQGDQILAATLDHAVFLWDAKTREQTRELHFETPAIYDAAFSPDGQRVAGGTYVGVAYVFDATSGERLLKFKAHKRSRRFEDVSIPGLDISPDGHMLATASSDESVRIWNMRDGKSIGRFDGHESDVWCVTFSPDGGRALSGAKSGELYLWNTTTGQAIHKLRGHNGNVFAAEFLPDGNRAITGSVSSDGNVLILWNLESGKAIKQFPEQISGVSGIAVAPNGRSFATAGVDGVIRLFHLPAPGAND